MLQTMAELHYISYKRQDIQQNIVKYLNDEFNNVYGICFDITKL